MCKTLQGGKPYPESSGAAWLVTCFALSSFELLLLQRILKGIVMRIEFQYLGRAYKLHSLIPHFLLMLLGDLLLFISIWQIQVEAAFRTRNMATSDF
jgi:hypothetical protein